MCSSDLERLDLPEDLHVLLRRHQPGFHRHSFSLVITVTDLPPLSPPYPHYRPHHRPDHQEVPYQVASPWIHYSRGPPSPCLWFFLPSHLPSLSPVACPGLRGRCQRQDSCEPHYPLERPQEAWFHGACPLTCCVSLGVYRLRLKVVHRLVLPPHCWRLVVRYQLPTVEPDQMRKLFINWATTLTPSNTSTTSGKPLSPFSLEVLTLITGGWTLSLRNGDLRSSLLQFRKISRLSVVVSTIPS